MDNYYELVKENFPEFLKNPLAVKFIDRTIYHINLVNKYANKLGLSFLEHDCSKLTMLLPAYMYFSKPNRTFAEDKILDIATFIHVTQASHHPEYWSSTSLEGFTRKNPTPNGPLDVYEMPEECLIEMTCDWCAVSEEKGNTPYEWLEKVDGKRWNFTMEQHDFLTDIMDQIWE